MGRERVVATVTARGVPCGDEPRRSRVRLMAEAELSFATVPDESVDATVGEAERRLLDGGERRRGRRRLDGEVDVGRRLAGGDFDVGRGGRCAEICGEEHDDEDGREGDQVDGDGEAGAERADAAAGLFVLLLVVVVLAAWPLPARGAALCAAV